MPEIGRYLQADSFALLDQYLYTNNNPLVLIDILGLTCTLAEVHKSIGYADILFSDWLSSRPYLAGAQSLQHWIKLIQCLRGNNNACVDFSKGYGCDPGTEHVTQAMNAHPKIRNCCQASRERVMGGMHWQILLDCEYRKKRANQSM